VKIYFVKNRSIILLVTFFALLRFLTSFRFELGTDEAHYVLYGKHLALSYFDHPPMVGWVQFVFTQLPLSIQVAARIPAILASAAASLLIDQWLQRKNYSAQSRFYALAGLNIAILFSALSFFLLPDTLLLVLVPWLSLATENLMTKKSWLNWLFFGLVLGLAGLTKYTAVLFLIPIAYYWVKTKSFKDFITPPFWCAVIIALIFISPVLIWNLQNDFISFKYQSGHVISFQTLNITAFLGAQISQFLGLSFLYLYAFPKAKTLHDRFDKILIMTPLIFFSFFALFENFLPHWTAPFFVLAIPWGVADTIEKHQGLTKKLKAAFIAASLLFVFIHAELGLHILPFSAAKDIQRDIQGWQEFTARSLQKSSYPLAVTNWTFGSRVKLYSELRGQPNLVVLDHRIDQFDIWEKEHAKTNNVLMLVEKKNETEFLSQVNCVQQKDLGFDGPIYKNEILVEFHLIECSGFSWK